jgi:hypothetical protein
MPPCAENETRVEPSPGLVGAMEDGRLEGIDLENRTTPYRDGDRADADRHSVIGDDGQ